MRFTKTTFGFAVWLGLMGISQPAWTHSGENTDRWSRAHLQGLPPDIRAHALQWEAACGAPIAASQQFALYLTVPGARFIALHYDDFRCRNKAAQCGASGCLHEVYVAAAGGGYRRVLQVHAHDIRLLAEGGTAMVEIAGPGGSRLLRWTGRGFAGK
jgi:hypothetical protein